MVLKSEFNIAYSKIYDEKEKLEMSIMQIEEGNVLLNHQLELKKNELHEVHAELRQRCDEIAVLIQSLDSLKQKANFMEEELKRYEVMLDESNECQRRLKQQFLELEESQREERANASDEMVKSELANKTSEVEKYEVELQKMKSEVENLKINFEENQQAHEQEMKDRDAQIGELQEQICELELVIVAKTEAEELHKQEMDNSIQLAEDRIAQLKNELIERESGDHALLVAHNILKQENEGFSSNIKEKDQKIQELQKQIESLDQNFRSAIEKEVTLDEALKRAEGQKILEIEEKTQIIANLEKEGNALRKSVIQSKLELETSLEARNLEMEEVKSQFGDEKKCFKARIEEIESQKEALLQQLSKSSVDREKFFAQLEGVCEQIGVFSRDDVELRGMLGKMLPISEEDSEPERNLLASGGLNDTTFSPSRKSIQVSFDGRPPLTELNS